MPGRAPSKWVGGWGLYTSGDCMHRPGAQPACFTGNLSALLVLNSALPYPPRSCLTHARWPCQLLLCLPAASHVTCLPCPDDHLRFSVKVRQIISHLLSGLMVCIKGQTDPQSGSCCGIKHHKLISHCGEPFWPPAEIWIQQIALYVIPFLTVLTPDPQ